MYHKYRTIRKLQCIVFKEKRLYSLPLVASMKTDVIFYELIKELPEIFFELIDNGSEDVLKVLSA